VDNVARSLAKVATMMTRGFLTVLIAGALLPAQPGAARADGKGQVKSGGNHPVKVIRYKAYDDGKGGDPERHALDLYRPADVKGFPVLFFVHGGGWTKGSKDGFAKHGQLFARNGIGFVAINYRLTPQVTHPGHIEDVARAFAWTHQHIRDYGGRPDQIFISGHSAGGHLVALLAADPGYLKAEQLSLTDIKGVIPISGVYTVGAGKVFGADPDLARLASPQAHTKGKHPPFLVLYAEKDGKNFDKMAEEFCKALQESGNTASTMMLKDRDHGSIMRNIANQDDPATQAILAFIARYSGLKLTAQ
jgi:acetyl esterase/lipase